MHNEYMIIFNQIISQTFDAPFVFFIVKLVLAMVLGILLGLERIYAHKTAGMRTYALVTVAAAFFVIIAQGFTSEVDPVIRMASQIIVGVGFLGAGLIIFKDGHIENLTTAAGMWMCAGIGMAVGFGMFREAIFVTILTFFVLGILSFAERAIRLRVFPDPAFEKSLEISAPKPAPRKRASKTKGIVVS
jgi:uncharacterized membrane protein YhiD involved in acid resistance